MIVSTMNSKEKAAKADSLFSILESRVDGFLERNEKHIFKSTKDKLQLKRTFRLGSEGEWEIEVNCFEIDKKHHNFQYNWYAWQKYFIAHGKNEINHGTGFYLLGTIQGNVIFDLPPHLISRFKDRFFDNPEKVTIDDVRTEIIKQLTLCRVEYMIGHESLMKEEDKANWKKYIGTNGSNAIIYAHTMDGQFFGNTYVKIVNDAAKPGYICLSTYMDNDELRYEQLAYSVEINKKQDKFCVSTKEIKEDAKKTIKKIAKAGDVRDGLIEQKKQTITEIANKKNSDSLMSALMKSRAHNIFRNLGQKAEDKLKKIGLLTL